MVVKRGLAGHVCQLPFVQQAALPLYHGIPGRSQVTNEPAGIGLFHALTQLMQQRPTHGLHGLSSHHESAVQLVKPEELAAVALERRVGAGEAEALAVCGLQLKKACGSL